VTVPVLVAVTDPRAEADIVAALGSADSGVTIVRRCVDLADMLAAAAAGLARVALVSADLRRLDQDAVMRLAVDGVVVVGVTAPGDDVAERRLLQLGVHEVALDVPDRAELVAAVGRAAAGATRELLDRADTESATPAADGSVRDGTVIAVWGPTGAPGRTTVAVGVAAELALLGLETLLVDADVYGGVVAQLLGLLDESPGVAAACRLANNGTLDLPGLARLAVQVQPRFRVLTGIARADRWPELRPAALEAVLRTARNLADVTVVDCGFCLESDEELSFDTAAPRRNGATLAALEEAEIVLAVASGDPVGLQRYVRGLSQLAEVLSDMTPVPVVNRVRAAAVGGGNAEREIRAALDRFAGVDARWMIPWDPKAFDAAVAAGRTLPEVAPSAPARQALQQLAAGLVNRPLQRGRRRLRRH
jgi:MinD-like ATPase involved in chromosome partitioning or flagellar assembly